MSGFLVPSSPGGDFRKSNKLKDPIGGARLSLQIPDLCTSLVQTIPSLKTNMLYHVCAACRWTPSMINSLPRECGSCFHLLASCPACPGEPGEGDRRCSSVDRIQTQPLARQSRLAKAQRASRFWYSDTWTPGGMMHATSSGGAGHWRLLSIGLFLLVHA